MEIYLKYNQESVALASSEKKTINDLTIELDSHTLKNVNSDYIIDAITNKVGDIAPRKNVKFEINLKIYGPQYAIADYIDLLTDYKQIQDYNQISLIMVIKPGANDKKRIPYTQKIGVLLDEINVSENIYNSEDCREIELVFVAPVCVVEIEIEPGRDYYSLTLGE